MRSEARTLWALGETVHAVVYFAPERAEIIERAGLKGGWMGYFASRSAPLGAVGPEPVIATFYNFHPSRVRRALPDAWRFCTPERALEGRYEVAAVALRRLLGDEVPGDEMRESTTILRDALGQADPAGRPLFAGNVALPEPDDPLLALWHWCTVWREYRGDAHVAALVSEGVGGCECHLLLAASSAIPEELLQGFRAWSDEEWRAAKEGLRVRGLLDAEGRITAEGRAVRERVEWITDERSADVWKKAGEEATRRLIELLKLPARLIVERGGIVFPNPIGLERDEVNGVLESRTAHA